MASSPARRIQHRLYQRDTDSFSPPRTAKGLTLLRILADLDVDILFTTRYAFSELELAELAQIAYQQESHERLFVGCISALSMRATELEPRPIPSAARRLNTLNLFPDAGITPVLALRPLMPSMTEEDIVDLLDAAVPTVKHVVSGWLYYNRHDQLGTTDAEPLGVSSALLDFDIAHSNSKEYRNEALMQFLQAECHERGMSSYVRSAGLIYDLRRGIAEPSRRQGKER